jgi:non-ribosomal peptide synthetase component F
MIDRVEAIAEALLKSGAGPDARILVYQQASTDWVCSMLAIMRIGGVYVPLDLRNPLSRLATLAKDCQPNAVLADDTTIGDAPQLGVAAVVDVSRVAASPKAPVPYPYVLARLCPRGALSNDADWLQPLAEITEGACSRGHPLVIADWLHSPSSTNTKTPASSFCSLLPYYYDLYLYDL